MKIPSLFFCLVPSDVFFLFLPTSLYGEKASSFPFPSPLLPFFFCLPLLATISREGRTLVLPPSLFLFLFLFLPFFPVPFFRRKVGEKRSNIPPFFFFFSISLWTPPRVFSPLSIPPFTRGLEYVTGARFFSFLSFSSFPCFFLFYVLRGFAATTISRDLFFFFFPPFPPPSFIPLPECVTLFPLSFFRFFPFLFP